MTKPKHFLFAAISLLIGLAWLDPVASLALTTTSPWTLYRTCLKSQPLLTKALTSASIMAASDAICQRLESAKILSEADPTTPMGGENKSPPVHDFRRTRHVAITGLVWGGPLSHFWFALLEHIVTTPNKVVGLFIRILLDAIVFNPFAISGYLTIRSILERKNRAQIIQKLRLRWKGAVVNAWRFRPAANIGKDFRLCCCIIVCDWKFGHCLG